MRVRNYSQHSAASRWQGKEVWIREVINHEHPRIFDTWWALYVNEKRTCLWLFNAGWAARDQKALSNYQIDGALQTENDVVTVRVQGSMFRPRGAWWVTGKSFHFSVSDSGLSFLFVTNAFGFFHGYNQGDTVTASVERLIGTTFLKLDAENVNAETTRSCGFDDPLVDAVEFNWTALMEAADCIVASAGTHQSTRSLSEPSFGEQSNK